MTQFGQAESGRVEIHRVRLEDDARAGVALADGADGLEGCHGVAVFEPLGVHAAVPLDFDFERARQRVHHRYADAVQAARETVVLSVELPAGVEFGQYEFDARELVLRMHIHGHAAAVVEDLDGPVGEQRDLNFRGVAADDFVDRVVHNLHHHVVRARGVRVHAGATAYRIQPGQHLN